MYIRQDTIYTKQFAKSFGFETFRDFLAWINNGVHIVDLREVLYTQLESNELMSQWGCDRLAEVLWLLALRGVSPQKLILR